jgi:hypothetical protein
MQVPNGSFTQAEILAAKEHNIEPAWLRRILTSYSEQLSKELPVNMVFKKDNEARRGGYCPNSMAQALKRR